MQFVYTDNHGLLTEYSYLLDNILGYSFITYFISVVNMFGPSLKQTNHSHIHILVYTTFETVTAQ